MDGKRVYVTAHYTAIAVDRASGHLIWRKSIWATRDGYSGSPTSVCTTANESLYAQGQASAGGGDSAMVFDLNPANGKVRWATWVDAVGGVSTVAVEDRTVLMNLTHEQAAFGAADGHRIWSYWRGFGLSDQPAVAYDHRLWVLDDMSNTMDIRTGERHAGFSGGPPAFYGGRMFDACAGDLLSEDVATRLVIFRRHLPSPVAYPPFVVNRLVLAVTADGVLHAFSLGGHELWHGAIGAPTNLPETGPWPWPGSQEGGPQPAIAAAHGTIVVPAGHRLTAWTGH